MYIAKNGIGHEKKTGKIYAAMRIMYFCSRISILHTNMETKYVYRKLSAVVEVAYRYFYGDSDRNEVGRILEKHAGYSGMESERHRRI